MVGSFAGVTDPGRRRRRNEDAFVAEPPLYRLEPDDPFHQSLWIIISITLFLIILITAPSRLPYA